MISDELLKSLIGLTENGAKETVKGIHNTAVEVQTTRQDSQSFMTDMMYNENRVRLEVENGLVVKAIVG